MIGPCMCGDLYCSSCGPAQGNSKCPCCGKWSEEGGCDNPEYCANQMRLADEWYAEHEKQWAKEEIDLGD